MNAEFVSLYARIGGEEGVSSLVDNFYAQVLADESLRGYFNDTPMDRLKSMQKEFFSIALGGPSEYSDIDLLRAHQGRGIKAADFKAFVDKLFGSLVEFDLNEDECYQIISSLNTYVEDITEDSQAGVI